MTLKSSETLSKRRADQLALRTKLQALEDEFVKQGKHHVTARTKRGVFTWLLPGTMNEPAEVIESGELVAIEEMIVRQRWDDIMVALQHGTFSCEPRP